MRKPIAFTIGLAQATARERGFECPLNVRRGLALFNKRSR